MCWINVRFKLNIHKKMIFKIYKKSNILQNRKQKQNWLMLIKKSWILYSCMKLVKSDNQFLHDYFFFFMEAMLFVLEPTGIIIRNSHNFAIWKCYSRFKQYRSIRTHWGHSFDGIYRRGVTSWIIQSYTSYLDSIGNRWFSESFWLS